MLKKIKELFAPMPLVESWAATHSTVASPDELIAAAIVESLGKHFDEWQAKDMVKFYMSGGLYAERARNLYTPQLHNKSKGIDVKFGIKTWNGGEYKDTKCADWKAEGTKVNGVPIDVRSADWIHIAYERIAKQQKSLQDAAAKAKATMERNEAAWNLAEKLLGMKRNEQGALVPVNTAKEKGNAEQRTTQAATSCA